MQCAEWWTLWWTRLSNNGYRVRRRAEFMIGPSISAKLTTNGPVHKAAVDELIKQNALDQRGRLSYGRLLSAVTLAYFFLATFLLFFTTGFLTLAATFFTAFLAAFF